MNEVILENINLAHKLANEYYKKNPIIEYEDLKQICYVGLIKAAKTFENSKRYCI